MTSSQPMRASESSDWLSSSSGAPGPMSVQEIREKPRDTTHPYAYANLERHAQPVDQNAHTAPNPAAAQTHLRPTLGGNLQAESIGVPSLPITFMPGKTCPTYPNNNRLLDRLGSKSCTYAT